MVEGEEGRLRELGQALPALDLHQGTEGQHQASGQATPHAALEVGQLPADDLPAAL